MLAITEKTMLEPVSRSAYREAMRLTASGVSIVATDGSAGRGGLTVSTLQSLSLDPPSIMLCIQANSPNMNLLRKNRVFIANMLASGQHAIAGLFAGGAIPDRDMHFDGPHWRTVTSGTPGLVGAPCVFDCVLANVFSYAPHRVVVGEAKGIEIGQAEPLIYVDRTYRHLHDEVGK